MSTDLTLGRVKTLPLLNSPTENRGVVTGTC